MKKTLFILLILFSFLSAQMKEMHIRGEPEVLPDEIVARRDANGRFCAAIKVVSDMDGLKYNSYNGIVGSIERNPGEDIVYLSSNEQVLIIYKSGYNPKKIILSEEGINLEPRTMWEITLIGEEEASEFPINIITNPENATIFIDGKEKETKKTHQVSEGEHAIKIIKHGYKKIIDSIEVSESNTLFEYELKELEPVKITIKSNPTAANIFINDVNEGKTNKQLFKYPGEYNLRISKNKYKTINKKINVSEDGENIWNFELVKTAATLIIRPNPADAEIYLDGNQEFSNTFDISPGTHKVEVKKEGYNPISRTINLKKGEEQTYNYNLSPKTGDLSVTVEPMATRVTMQQGNKNIDSWTGSKYIKDVPIGNYQLTMKVEGYKTRSHDIKILENQTREINIQMKRGIPGMPQKYIGSIKKIPKEIRWSNPHKGFFEGFANHIPGVGTLLGLSWSKSKPYKYLAGINITLSTAFYFVFDSYNELFNSSSFIDRNDIKIWQSYWGISILAGIITDRIAIGHDKKILEEHNSYYSKYIKENRFKLSIIPIDKGGLVNISYIF